MRKCIECGATEEETKVYNYNGEYILCRKHYLQMTRHGKLYDRTIYDPNKITIKGDIAEIELYDKDGNVRDIAIIDAEDIPKVENYKMYFSRGYVRLSESGGGKLFLHRVVLGVEDGFVDHINHNGLDNRKENLRIATTQKNTYNMDKGIYKGVKKVPVGRFSANIYNNYQNYYIGTYDIKNHALYARYIGELHFCPEFRDKQYDDEKFKIFDNISESRKTEIENEVNERIAKTKKRLGVV